MKGECIWISGASSGIGEACARRFAQAGAKTLLIARREERLRTLARELGEGCEVLVLDLGQRQALTEALTRLPASHAQPSVLINNAGGAIGLDPAQEAEMDDWEAMVDINVKGLLYLTRAVLPTMIAVGKGHIVNLGSVAGSYPYPGGNVYGACKAFVAQLSRNLRADLLGTPLRVSNIEPGLVDTEFSTVRFKGDEARAAGVYQGMEPLHASDIAEAVFWCVSRPAHVNINAIELMPVAQAWSGFRVMRES